MICRVLFILMLAANLRAAEPRGELVESMPPAQQILAFARAQLPPHPVFMSGTLKERAPNGFLKTTLNVEMELDWSAKPACAVYRINDPGNDRLLTLEIFWKAGEPEYSFYQNGEKAAFDPHGEIDHLGITWSDLSFSFLWNENARTLRAGKKLGSDCFVISVPRPGAHSLLLWVEQKTGRMLGAEEQDADGKTQKIIKVVSVKEFDGLWMVKDLDIIRPANGGRTSLRVDTVTAGAN